MGHTELGQHKSNAQVKNFLWFNPACKWNEITMWGSPSRRRPQGFASTTEFQNFIWAFYQKFSARLAKSWDFDESTKYKRTCGAFENGANFFGRVNSWSDIAFLRWPPATNGSLVLMPNGHLSLVTAGREDQQGPTRTNAKMLYHH